MPIGFYVTDKGKEAVAKAIAEDTKVKISKVALGSGGDQNAPWNYGIESLVSQFYEKNFDPETDTYEVDRDDPTQVMICSVIPNEVSGTINEIGYKDDKDNLIIYGVIRERTKVAGEGAEINRMQFNSWIKFESEEIENIQINVLSAEYQLLDDKVTAAVGKVEKMEGTVSQLEEGQNTLEPRVEALETEINGVTASINALADELEELS